MSLLDALKYFMESLGIISAIKRLILNHPDQLWGVRGKDGGDIEEASVACPRGPALLCKSQVVGPLSRMYSGFAELR